MATVTSDAKSAESRAQGSHSIQLVGFRLAGEEYGVEITKVQEIILLGEITRLPETPPYVKGLINLRNRVIPVVDLRLRFGLPEQASSDETRIVVVNVAGRTVGIIVDAVSEVLRISREEISPPPAVAGLGREYLSGLVKRDQGLLILLDIDKILSPQEQEAVESLAAG